MERLNNVLAEKARNIKWLFTDVDGTLTDGTVFYSSGGEALKPFSLRDGTGFFLLRECGIHVGIITGEDSPIVARRAKKLQVDALLMKAVPKTATLQNFLTERDLSFQEVAYIGDDLNDIHLMQLCGLSFAVGDASERAKAKADIVCRAAGGAGAFREAVELLLAYRDENIDRIIEQRL